MNPLGLFSQILAVSLALTIGYFYVQPTIDEIGIIQTDTATYKAERIKIESINSQLAADMATFQSIPRADKERLATYMPKFLDDISVMRDISFIVQEASVVSTELSYDGALNEDQKVFSQSDNSQSGLPSQPAIPHSFSLTLQGTYPNIKAFLRLLEQNEYPLEVHQLTVSADETGLLSVSMQLVTYVDQLVLVTNN